MCLHFLKGLMVSYEFLHYSLLQVDNDGESQISEDTAILNEGYILDLSSTSYDKGTSYTTPEGHSVCIF